MPIFKQETPQSIGQKISAAAGFLLNRTVAPVKGNAVNGDAISAASAVRVDDKIFEHNAGNANAVTYLPESPGVDGALLTSGEGYGVPLLDASRLRHLNRLALLEVERKLRQQEAVVIGWLGDSNSDNGTQEVQTSFRSGMQTTYPNVTVTNRTTSGMTAHRVFSWQSSDPASDLSVIFLGTNDALWDRHTKDGGAISDYEFNLRAVVSREILRGKAVVIVSAPPTRSDYAMSGYAAPATDPFGVANIRPDVPVLRSVGEMVAEETASKFVDLWELFSMYSDQVFINNDANGMQDGTAYGDPVHFDSSYRQAIGKFVAVALSCGNLVNTYEAHAGSRFGVRCGLDPVCVNVAPGTLQAKQRFDLSRDSTHCYSEDSPEAEYKGLFLNTVGNKLTWSFYAADGDLVAAPVVYIFGSSEVKITHNFDSVAPKMVVDPERKGVDWQGFDALGADSVTYTPGASLVLLPSGTDETGFTTVEACECKLVRSGWHSITVEIVSGSAIVSGLVFSRGLAGVLRGEMATQKTALETQIAGVNDVVTIAGAEDLNNYRDSGNFFAGNTVVNIPVDSASWRIIENFSPTAGTYTLQKSTGSNGVIYSRKYEASVWSAWVAA